MTDELDLRDLLATEMWQSHVAKLLSEAPEYGKEDVSLWPSTTRKVLAKTQINLNPPLVGAPQGELSAGKLY
jgi:hypothetical protein